MPPPRKISPLLAILEYDLCKANIKYCIYVISIDFTMPTFQLMHSTETLDKSTISTQFDSKNILLITCDSSPGERYYLVMGRK
jgi:hypothetical protein